MYFGKQNVTLTADDVSGQTEERALPFKHSTPIRFQQTLLLRIVGMQSMQYGRHRCETSPRSIDLVLCTILISVFVAVFNVLGIVNRLFVENHFAWYSLASVFVNNSFVID